jgi:hypothetical protein
MDLNLVLTENLSVIGVRIFAQSKSFQRYTKDFNAGRSTT